jgi:uncharacterized membrane protein YfcA
VVTALPGAVATRDGILVAGFITGVAGVIGSVLALIGVLATGESDDTSGVSSGVVSTTTTSDVSCIAVVKAYRVEIQSSSKMLALLTTAGPDGVSPVQADPAARRCGLGETSLMQMR